MSTKDENFQFFAPLAPPPIKRRKSSKNRSKGKAGYVSDVTVDLNNIASSINQCMKSRLAEFSDSEFAISDHDLKKSKPVSNSKPNLLIGRSKSHDLTDSRQQLKTIMADSSDSDLEFDHLVQQDAILSAKSLEVKINNPSTNSPKSSMKSKDLSTTNSPKSAVKSKDSSTKSPKRSVKSKDMSLNSPKSSPKVVSSNSDMSPSLLKASTTKNNKKKNNKVKVHDENIPKSNLESSGSTSASISSPDVSSKRLPVVSSISKMCREQRKKEHLQKQAAKKSPKKGLTKKSETKTFNKQSVSPSKNSDPQEEITIVPETQMTSSEESEVSDESADQVQRKPQGVVPPDYKVSDSSSSDDEDVKSRLTQSTFKTASQSKSQKLKSEISNSPAKESPPITKSFDKEISSGQSSSEPSKKKSPKKVKNTDIVNKKSPSHGNPLEETVIPAIPPEGLQLGSDSSSEDELPKLSQEKTQATNFLNTLKLSPKKKQSHSSEDNMFTKLKENSKLARPGKTKIDPASTGNSNADQSIKSPKGGQTAANDSDLEEELCLSKSFEDELKKRAAQRAVKEPTPLSPIAEHGGLFYEDLDSQDTELWLIRAPVGVDITSLSKKKILLDGSQSVGSLGQNNASYEIQVTKLEQMQAVNMVALFPSKSQANIRPGPNLRGQLDLVQSVIIPPVILPNVQPKCAKPMPEGLKPRYQPFGSGSPVKRNLMQLSQSKDFKSTSDRLSKKSRKRDKHHHDHHTDNGMNKDHGNSSSQNELLESSQGHSSKKKKKKHQKDVDEIEFPVSPPAVEHRKKKKKRKHKENEANETEMNSTFEEPLVVITEEKNSSQKKSKKHKKSMSEDSCYMTDFKTDHESPTESQEVHIKKHKKKKRKKNKENR